MTNGLPAALKSGQAARLFPDFAVTSREKRITSILLALVPQIPELARTIFSTVGVRIGVRSTIDAWTEVVFKNDIEGACRPDGFICIRNGKSEWTALIEAKIGRANLEADQVQRYLELAKSNRVDAVITISNEFVTQASHSPVEIPRSKRRNVDLYHWSWTWIATECEILQSQTAVTDKEQAFLLNEFHHFLNSDGTGVERFKQMGSKWKELVNACVQKKSLNWNSAEVEDGVSAWFMEERDLELQLSRLVGEPVSTVIERKHRDDPSARLKDASIRLLDSHCLDSSYRVPNAAGDLEISADLARRSLQVSIRLRAPEDKVKTRSRMTWLLRMLKDDDPRILIRAHWPGKAKATERSLAKLREDPESIQADNGALVPHSFEVIMVHTDAKRFAGRQTFVEDIEAIVPLFYTMVAQYLRAWSAPPPKPRPTTLSDSTDTGELEGARSEDLVSLDRDG